MKISNKAIDDKIVAMCLALAPDTVQCLQCNTPMHYQDGVCPQCGYVEFKS
jgi:hypothetical protein